MNSDIFDHPLIITEEETKKLGINLSNLEKIATRKTQLGFVSKEIKEVLRESAAREGASLVVLTDESCYGGLYVDKYQHTYDLYRQPKHL
ncbi:hypothetical protein HN865_04645 [Candidatus Woesearchaeota archaeon]|jgi:hypothetical protein|nr:hypothetical protein [Candidatus Woesearchaeota archaeon]MBT7238112.1 hypothetical protein [Candidatus Woesearchaeota archaeon]